MKRFHHVLMAGAVGVGKTMIAEALIGNLPEGRVSMTINFSAQTSSNSLQVHFWKRNHGISRKHCLGIAVPVPAVVIFLLLRSKTIHLSEACSSVLFPQPQRATVPRRILQLLL